MKVISLRQLLLYGTCCWLIWTTPLQARVLQVDPVGYKDQSNLYAYVGNDPVNLTDPSGREILGPDDNAKRRLVERLINARAGAPGFRYVFRGTDHRLVREREPGSRVLTGTRLGTSTYHARRLDQAIRSERRIDVRVQPTVQRPDGTTVDINQTYSGGVTIPDGQGN